MSNQINQDALYQHWVHSHEEDTNTEIVFRPATYNFPRSRGRRSFELKTDGILVEGAWLRMTADKRRRGDGNCKTATRSSFIRRQLHNPAESCLLFLWTRTGWL